ncbi:hypothetical protein [Enhygromyxa salina]|uniref:hypothetical protein n=1 Tax=Enhygromyxa salina TaxID=215803 RepID=UPI000D04118F|nr:hypothetical protein [Enhygromyxa salina]
MLGRARRLATLGLHFALAFSGELLGQRRASTGGLCWRHILGPVVGHLVAAVHELNEAIERGEPIDEAPVPIIDDRVLLRDPSAHGGEQLGPDLVILGLGWLTSLDRPEFLAGGGQARLREHLTNHGQLLERARLGGVARRQSSSPSAAAACW